MPAPHIANNAYIKVAKAKPIAFILWVFSSSACKNFNSAIAQKAYASNVDSVESMAININAFIRPFV